MQTIRKALEILLTLCILFGCMTGVQTAFAEETDPAAVAPEESWDDEDWDDEDWDDDDWDDDDWDDDDWDDGDWDDEDWDDYFNISTEGGLAVFDASDERYQRETDPEDGEFDEDEYLSYSLIVRNNEEGDERERAVSYRVDGGIERPFSEVSEQEGGTRRYHIDLADMAVMDPGLHEIEVIVGGEVLRTDRIYIPRNWEEIMPSPTKEQMENVEPFLRSTYVVYYPVFGDTTGISEYAIDLSVDASDKGTYFNALTATVDTSALKKKGLDLQNNYGNPGAIYCGFQQWEDGKTGIIMSVWDILYDDANNNRHTIKATPLYADEKARIKSELGESSGEGNFQQFLIDYPWQESHPYRMLTQVGKNDANGNATLTLQVCDLQSQEWKKLVTWDLGYPSDSIQTNELCGFLENYLVPYNASVRSANFSNIRGRSAANGEWVAADSVRFTVNNSLESLDYVGSYQFGADDSSFYAITTGVDDLCQPQQSGTVCTVKNASTQSPY